MPKHLLRKTLLKRRLSLTVSEKVEASRVIQDIFMASPEYLAANSIAIYSAVNGEVSTDKVMSHTLSVGKALFLPAVEGDLMRFRRINSLDDFVVGSFGIMQPGFECAIADPEDIDIIVVPGVGFDRSGQRIGYGKGYYDRTLHRLEGRGRLIAFCYDCQLVDSLAGEQHDVSMDRIITEQRVVNTALLK